MRQLIIILHLIDAVSLVDDLRDQIRSVPQEHKIL